MQTNETSRAVAWLWPAALAGCADGRRPLTLFDVGCSAGLNLAGDRLRAAWTDGAGAPLPVATTATIVGRHGFDLAPLDIGRDDDLTWLRACVWPGETARLERLDAAVDAFRALAQGPVPPRLETADLADVPSHLERLARGRRPGSPARLPDSRPRLPARRDQGPLPRGDDPLGGGAPARSQPRSGSSSNQWPTPGRIRRCRWRSTPMSPTAPAAPRRLTLARCSYHPDRLAPDAAARVAEFTRVESIEKFDGRARRPYRGRYEEAR